ncbi:hypothetical protein ACVI1K_000010 [Bradyrhizobium sp. USDA 4508]
MARERTKRGPCTFTEADLKRGINAARKSGLKVRSVEFRMTLIVEDNDGVVTERESDLDRAIRTNGQD